MTNLKNILSYLCLALLIVPVFTACMDDDNLAKFIETKVQINLPEGYSGGKDGLPIKATSASTGKSFVAETNTDGFATFSLDAGLYTFSVSAENDDYALNGITEGIKVVVNTTPIDIDLIATALNGGLIIKEIYYVGSRTPANKTYMADQFFEIYNNSDEVIYLDNLGFGTMDPNTSNSPSVWVDADGELMNRLPLFGFSFYIKGSGTDHPLQPRTSVVIAVDGIDHKNDPNGNPDSPVDLSNATWETYVGDINGGKDADAAGVANAGILHTTSTSLNDFIPSINGPVILIFQFPEGVDPLEFASKEENLMRKPGTSASTQYLMIPTEYVVDAVECVNAVESRRFKRVPDYLDAGYIFINGTYNGMSVRRKVKDIIGGNVIYKDTNNTTEDFEVIDTPTPFVHPTSVSN